MATLWHTSDNKEAVRSCISLWRIVGKLLKWYKMITRLGDSSHTSNKVMSETNQLSQLYIHPIIIITDGCQNQTSTN